MGTNSRRRKRQRKKYAEQGRVGAPSNDFEPTYKQAVALAEQADFSAARGIFSKLGEEQLRPRLRALVENDLGTLDALAGELAEAHSHFERALAIDPGCQVARQNLDLIAADEVEAAMAMARDTSDVRTVSVPPGGSVRVAIISLLFNWPSSGGGTVHTAETGKFLSRAGYDVRHIYAQYDGWSIGNVSLPLDVPSEPLKFTAADWNAGEIQRRFREAVATFNPDYVIITDSWNFKPLLAEAVEGYRYFLRLAAQECLCPLNNVRLLVDDDGQFSACPRNQLATADACQTCVSRRQHQSGSLHQAERQLSGYGTADYDRRLRRAFAKAEGVLAVNPLIAAAVSPFAKAVHVVPSGFDPDRFSWPWPDESNTDTNGKFTIFFAGVVKEYMKGFYVLHSACARLWSKRQDFELVATEDPPQRVDAMTRFIGWQPQSELPRHLRKADCLVFPTIAEEALGRSAVEAMGVGRPVIASRIGGLPFTVTEGLTGLLFEPGNDEELAAKIELLLDDPALCQRMGSAGRQRFVEHFTWDAVIDRDYRRLLKPVRTAPADSLPTPVAVKRDNAGEGVPALLDETANLFGMSQAEVKRMFETFLQMRRLGTRSTVALGQEFVVCLLLSLTRPETIAVVACNPALAVQQLRDTAMKVGLDNRIVRFDMTSGRLSETAHESVFDGISPDDFEFKPVSPSTSGSFQAEVLDRYGSGLIWLEGVSETQAEEVVCAASRHFGQWMVAFGGATVDRRRGGQSRIARRAGFQGDPDHLTNGTHRMQTLESAGGLTLIVPDHICACREET